MSIGKASNFQVYDEQFQAGLWEGVTQYTSAFNEGSANAIRLVAKDLLGDYARQAFFKSMSNLILEHNTSSTSIATVLPVTQSELISVKVNRRIGPVDQTLDAWRKIGYDARRASFELGRTVAEAKVKDYLNTALLSVEAALAGQSDLVHDATGTTSSTLTPAHLVSGLKKMGDAANRVVAWVMHSKPYFDLLANNISEKITNVADQAIIYGGLPATLGRPVVVTDAPALHDDNGTATDTYNVLGLVEGAVTVTESEQSEIVTDIVTGLESLVMRFQGEYGFNIGCRGFQWDTVNGGANPTASELGTSTNWDKVATSVKDLAGVRVIVE